MPFNDMLGRLAQPIEGRAGRISSNQQPEWNSGNWDMSQIPAGTTLELPLIEGPAVIAHVWFTSHAGHVDKLDSLVLRIYWDGCEEPGVEAPVGDFFACGHGKRLVVDSLPVQVSESGSLTCYWRMPFRESARITVTNEHPTDGTGLYWQVDYLSVPEIPADTPYFRAHYRREYPCEMGTDYLLLHTEGKGHYVGSVMSITMCQDGWFGEGDDFFFIDGEEIPSLQGTGSEDYFNDAWGFRERTTAFFGQPLWEGYSAGDRGCAYRWHVLDPVPFERSLKVMIEHKGNMEPPCEGWYVERPDYFSSVAFWYQTGAPKPFAPLPSYAERQLPWTVLRLSDWLAEVKTTGGGEITPQWLGDRAIIFWKNEDPAGSIEIPFDVPETLRCAAKLRVVTSYDYGIWDVALDGEVLLRDVDLYGSDTGSRDLRLGVREVAVGRHTLTLTCRGCNEKARGVAGGPSYYIGLDAVRLLALPEPVMRPMGKRGREERHWIWRAINDAVRAFRAVRKTTPRSLRELVDAGLLGERYLRDENHQPLESRREGDGFVVESVGMDGVKGTEDDWTRTF